MSMENAGDVVPDPSPFATDMRQLCGAQAEYVRVPFADIGPRKLENGLADEQVLSPLPPLHR
jgi:threonine dehydrogenase-like Zn-dependent dehydrogenase